MESVRPVNEVEQQLKEAGEQLASPPSSTKDLLDLLDKTEQLLTFVGQAPSISMQGALVPPMGALIADELLRHSDMDVRISVASCLCEVARITAPDPPYKDDIMKEIFQLNVIAFRELSNMNSCSYHKAIHILESSAKVKSCLLMLDLECDSLILEMFDQFLSRIRINHPDTIFSDMEAIMTLAIKESDEISEELLTLLISHVRKENQNTSPVSWKLAEKVLRNCEGTLKAYSQTLLNVIKSDLDDYAEVVTALCRSGIKRTKANNIHKRNVNSLEKGGSTKTHMHSQSKKQKYSDTDTQRFVAGPKKGKKPETASSNKKTILNHDTRSNLGQDLMRTRSRDKASNSAGLSLKRSTENPQKQSSKTKGSIKIPGSLYNVVIKKEDESLSDSSAAEPPFQQVTNKTQNRRKPSSKKHVGDGSQGKNLKQAYNSRVYGKELVGCRIKVWWPLDRTFYEGAVSSYDPSDKKHKVLYADGDEEVLDLREEKWSLLDGMLPDQEQVAVSPSPVTSAKNIKQKGKRKLEPLSKQKDNSNASKSPAQAYPPKTKPTEENSVKGANNSTTDIPINVNNQENVPVQKPDTSSGLKFTEMTNKDVGQDGKPDPNGLLEEMETESEKKSQRPENNEGLVCET